MIKHYDFTHSDNSNIYRIIEMMNKENKIRFSLLCIKDCFHLVNDDKVKTNVQTYIDFAEKWLNLNKNQRRIIKHQIINIFDCLSDDNRRSSTNYVHVAAYNSANIFTTYHPYDTNTCCSLSINSSISAFYFDNNGKHIVNRWSKGQKNQEYTNLAKSFFSTTDFKHTSLSKSFLKYGINKESIFALLDHLIETGEDIVLFDDHTAKLNIPFEVFETNMNELANRISNNMFLIEYIRRLYG